MKRLSYRASVDFLFDLQRSGIKLGLDNTFNLLSAIGDPHTRFESIHIAGTNGKGSVACFLSSILFHNGLRTGLFTSPHLVDYRERIRKDGTAISRGELAEIVSSLAEPITRTGVTYFEATTVLAFEYFRRQNVQIAAVEVGMGGRLDSTNVVKPLASCITSIGFDHEKYLGRTISKIAWEKAGIVKPGVPVVCGYLSSQASRTIHSVARSKGARVYEMGREASSRPLRMGIDGSCFEYRGLSSKRVLEIRSPGLHQITNAAIATLAAEVLNQAGFTITDEAIETGLRRAFWPGRVQVLRRRPLVVCDAAHNVSGARVLASSLKEMGFDSDITVFGVLRDKDYQRMLSLLSKCSRQFVFTKPASPRALPLWKLKRAGRGLGVRFKGFSSMSSALDYVLDVAGRDKKILKCGSLYVLGEAMRFFDFKPYLGRLY